MWQVELFDYETRTWFGWGSVSRDFHYINRLCESLAHFGQKVRIRRRADK